MSRKLNRATLLIENVFLIREVIIFMEREEVTNLLEFLEKETKKYVVENPHGDFYNFLEEADLQAFLYGKISKYYNEKEKGVYFSDDSGKKNKKKLINIYKIHCEYPRHVVETTDNGEEKLRCNRGRHDIVILKKLDKGDDKFIDNTLIKYPVDVAFELKLIWRDNTTSVRTDAVVNKMEEDLWVFGWDSDNDEEEGKFDPNPRYNGNKLPSNKRRVYPKTGVVFQVHLVREGKGVKDDFRDKLNEIIKKRSEYKGDDLPDIFIVYIEIDRYSKEVTKSFVIP